ncbi:MAG: hypothetical protein GX109_05560 [Bacteroidales bacterium]|jgi:hypothetical protein|nr:hypothetical protein [Bacteroidales bacterium]MDD3330863.1 hypothetical protein [Bacteroidales bacterium]MDD3691417.1 hypothetical protein [Bacteroidales bacterium]MDD4044925.1 hypothetical protein [Bacteroidales bacterium]MDD4581555.1 hypothetical protein [Bacteroidales bacterium]
MKKLIIFGVFILISNNFYAQHNEFLLDTDKAGLFKLTMNLEYALEVCKSKYVVEKSFLSLEGDNYDVYNVKLDGQLLLKLEPDCESVCKIGRIWVYSDLYKTSKGIGIGSTLEEILENYSFKFLQTEGEGSVFLQINENDINFELDPVVFTNDWWKNGAKFEDIPKETKVTMIIL